MSRPNALPAAIGGNAMRFIIALIAASAFAISPAMAKDSGFYLGAGVGSFGLDVDGIEEGVNFSGDDVGFKLLGGYKINKYFGAELEYIDGGSVEDKYDMDGDKLKLAVDLSGFNLSVLAAYPFAESFDVFGKLGAVFWDADFKASFMGVSERATDDGNDFSWGIGASWYFTDNFGARIEYQGFEIEDADTDMISLGVTYIF